MTIIVMRRIRPLIDIKKQNKIPSNMSVQRPEKDLLYFLCVFAKSTYNFMDEDS